MPKIHDPMSYLLRLPLDQRARAAENLSTLSRRALASFAYLAAANDLAVTAKLGDHPGYPVLHAHDRLGTVHVLARQLAAQISYVDHDVTKLLGTDEAYERTVMDSLAGKLAGAFTQAGSTISGLDGAKLTELTSCLEPTIRFLRKGEPLMPGRELRIHPKEADEADDRIHSDHGILVDLASRGLYEASFGLAAVLAPVMAQYLWTEARTLPDRDYRRIDRSALATGSIYARLRLEGALARMIEYVCAQMGDERPIDVFGIAHRAVACTR